MKKLFSVFLICIFILAFIMPMLPTAKADITATRTFIASANDAYIEEFSNVYSTAHNSVSATLWNYQYTNYLGQRLVDGVTYYIWRAFLYFDTSSIPDGVTIDSAVLSLYVATDYSTTNFNVTIQNGQPIYPHNPPENNDYYYTQYSGDGGNRNTSTVSGAGYWNITLSTDGLAWIQDDQTTKLCLRSNNDINSNPPTTNEWLEIYSKEQGDSYAPILYVTYTTSGEYTYNFYGPYVDGTGGVYGGHVSCTVYQSYNVSESFELDGSGGADSASIAFEQAAIMVAWNITDSGNYTRTYYFDGSTTEDVYIFVPSPDLPIGLYTFTVTDFRGITDGYVEVLTNLGTGSKIVSRKPVDSINPISFYLSWSVAYQVRVVCNEGTLNVGTFTALDQANQNIIIAYDSFPVTYYGWNATVSCARINSTLIQMNYTDNAAATVWVNLDVTVQNILGHSTAYSVNNTGSSVQVNWNLADPSTDYLATVTFYRSGGTYIYKFACPAPREGNTNPWAFLPEPYCYAVAIALAVVAGLVFSYFYVAAGAWAMVGFGVFFAAIGWLPQTAGTWGVLGFGGLVAGIITIAEFRKTERFT